MALSMWQQTGTAVMLAEHFRPSCLCIEMHSRDRSTVGGDIGLHQLARKMTSFSCDASMQ